MYYDQWLEYLEANLLQSESSSEESSLDESVNERQQIDIRIKQKIQSVAKKDKTNRIPIKNVRPRAMDTIVEIEIDTE